MNAVIERFTREQIKEGLAQLPEENHRVFKLMYSHRNLEKPIDDVVDSMPAEKLDWALSQVQSSIAKFQMGKEKEPKYVPPARCAKNHSGNRSLHLVPGGWYECAGCGYFYGVVPAETSKAQGGAK